MQIWQTLEHVAYQNIHNETVYDGIVSRNVCQHVENCGKPKASIHHGAIKIKSLGLPATCSARNLDRTRELMQEEETHNVSDMSKDG